MRREGKVSQQFAWTVGRKLDVHRGQLLKAHAASISHMALDLKLPQRGSYQHLHILDAAIREFDNRHRHAPIVECFCVGPSRPSHRIILEWVVSEKCRAGSLYTGFDHCSREESNWDESANGLAFPLPPCLKFSVPDLLLLRRSFIVGEGCEHLLETSLLHHVA